jgi:predicted GNAT family acetyltransferase
MLVGISPGNLDAYHTEAMIEGKGFARKLLESMVAYAREHHLKLRHIVLMFMPNSNVIPNSTMIFGIEKKRNSSGLRK